MSSDHPPFYEEDEGTAQIRISQLPSPRKSDSEHPYVIVYAGDSAGRVVPVHDELTVGRSPSATLQLTGEGVSRLHARLYRPDGPNSPIVIEDLGSTNGTRVNGSDLEGPRKLSDGDQIQVGANLILKFSLQDEAQARLQQALYEAALRDPLTRAYNRRALVERMETDLSHSLRHGAPLSLLMFDLDHFKQVNDRHGHLGGDYVLREFAEIVRAAIRREDLFARYGGEEFAVLCRSTDVRHAADLADRIRGLVNATRFDFGGATIPVTVSVGVASAYPGATVEGLIERADRMLYQAKRAGRDRVVADR
ncbi:MAG: GGDEF domain-containing protein [Sandaracinaceae bacterium]